jgi:hypothetical protein
MRMKEIRAMMCDEGWPHIKGRKTQPNPLACAECESMCLGCVQLLKKINDEEFRDLLCGGDCANCRQPCNLRRLAIMRKIKPAVVRKREKPKASTWLDIALKPYYDRHPERRPRECGRGNMSETYGSS